MKTEKEIKEKIEELKEDVRINAKCRDWKEVISAGEQLEALNWVLEED